MSNETLTWLNQNTLIGYTDKRGNAWHYRASGQGEEPNHYPGAIPVEDVKRRLFDWQPVVADLTATHVDLDGVHSIEVPKHKAMLRSDTHAVLGIVSETYRPHEYGEWLVDNVSTILDADLAIGSAGLLRGGAVAWVQVEMEDTIDVRGVEFRPFLTAATSLDRSLASTYQTGAQVVVCDNTLSAALADKEAQQYRVRHTSGSLARIHDVRDALSIVHGIADAFTAEVEALTARTVSDEQWRAFTLAYTDTGSDSTRARSIASGKIDALDRMWNHDERVSPWKGTAWGVLAAANTWLHHEAPVKNVSRVERNLERAVTGDVAKADRKVLDTLERVLA